MPRKELAAYLTSIAVLILIIPLTAGLAAGYSAPKILSMVGSLVLLEYVALFIFLPLKVPIWLAFTLTLSVGLASILAFYLIADIFTDRSPRIQAFLQKAETRARDNKFIRNYAVYGLIPGILLVGVYLSAAITVMAGWDRPRATLVMFLGLICASILVYLVAAGVISGLGLIF